MNIGIMGTGTVARTLAATLAGQGHHIMLGTRNVEATLARSWKDGDFRTWLSDHSPTEAGTFRAAAQGEIVINATAGEGSLEALKAAGEENLNGKILMDIANPLDFSQGMPPTLAVCNTDSLGEQIQRAFPEAKVVKTLNTMNARLMADPHALAGGDHHVFLSGNDPEAKAKVAGYLNSWFGWEHLIDLGDITTARGTEMLLPVWLRLWGALGTPMFNFKIVKRID